MHGRVEFSAAEAAALRRLIREKQSADAGRQKTLRARMRRLGFRISDFDACLGGFSVAEFDDLVARGAISVGGAPGDGDRRRRPNPGQDAAAAERCGRVVLVGCVKSKRPGRHPARDLYSSPLWRARRGYAEASGDGWFVLSALHGLLEPDAPVESYDLALGTRPRRRAARVGGGGRAGARPAAREPVWSDGRGARGGAYLRALRPALEQRGAAVAAPLAALPGIGAQLAWYRDHAPVQPRRRQATAGEVEAALRDLDAEPQSVAAATWPADLPDLDVPGLYSWWVNADGARDLSAGLGAPIAAGRIYAGLTGATKWPSGRSGKNTLRKRIRAHHIGGRVRGSTFRLTLAAVLRSSLGLGVLGPTLLAPEAEADLSRWIKRHLAVAVHRFPDPDPLADLERRVSPASTRRSLEGMPPTPLRARLGRQREAIARAPGVTP